MTPWLAYPVMFCLGLAAGVFICFVAYVALRTWNSLAWERSDG